MKVGDAYPSRFLKADDLGGKDVTVKIKTVELEDVGGQGQKENKLVIGFEGKTKLLVCNKTNAGTIAKVTGSQDTDDWIGKSIIIGPREVEFQGDQVWAIRVSLKAPAAAAKPAPAKPAPPQDDADPFAGEGDANPDSF